MTQRSVALLVPFALLVAATVAPGVSAQRGRGGAGSVAQVETRGRLQILTDVLALDNDQKKQVKTILDTAHKGAAPIRAELAKTRAALAAAVQGNQGDAAIEAAAKTYAAQVSAMTAAEMKALAEILSPLKPEQRQQGTSPAFYLMRGIFLDDRRWDEIPPVRMY
jgi:Spy/CpxP family protein refolding chaperone